MIVPVASQMPAAAASATTETNREQPSSPEERTSHEEEAGAVGAAVSDGAEEEDAAASPEPSSGAADGNSNAIEGERREEEEERSIEQEQQQLTAIGMGGPATSNGEALSSGLYVVSASPNFTADAPTRTLLRQVDALLRCFSNILVPIIPFLKELRPIATLQWRRGKTRQSVVDVLSLGDPYQFGLDWCTRSKSALPALCIHGAVNGFQYAKERFYVISRVHDNVPSYACLCNDDHVLSAVRQAGFQATAMDAIRLAVDTYLRYSTTQRNSGKTIYPQKNFVCLNSSEEYLRFVFRGTNKDAVMERLEEELARQKTELPRKMQNNLEAFFGRVFSDSPLQSSTQQSQSGLNVLAEAADGSDKETGSKTAETSSAAEPNSEKEVPTRASRQQRTSLASPSNGTEKRPKLASSVSATAVRSESSQDGTNDAASSSAQQQQSPNGSPPVTIAAATTPAPIGMMMNPTTFIVPSMPMPIGQQLVFSPGNHQTVPAASNAAPTTHFAPMYSMGQPGQGGHQIMQILPQHAGQPAQIMHVIPQQYMQMFQQPGGASFVQMVHPTVQGQQPAQNNANQGQQIMHFLPGGQMQILQPQGGAGSYMQLIQSAQPQTHLQQPQQQQQQQQQQSPQQGDQSQVAPAQPQHSHPQFVNPMMNPAAMWPMGMTATPTILVLNVSGDQMQGGAPGVVFNKPQ